MPYLSSNSVLSFAKETDFGDMPSRNSSNFNNAFGITDRDVELPDRRQNVRPVQSFGVGRKYSNVIKQNFEYAGTIPFLPLDGKVFYWAFGADSTEQKDLDGDGTADDLVHNVSSREEFGMPSVSLLGSLKGNSSSPTFQRAWPGTVCSTASFSASVQGELSMEASIYSLTPRDWDDSISSVPDAVVPDSETGYGEAGVGRPYQWFHVGGENGQVDIGGDNITRLEEIQVRYDNRLQPKYYFRSGDLDGEGEAGDSGRAPAEYIQRLPRYTVTGRFVPNNRLTGNADSIYERLMSGDLVDFSIKFERATKDYIKFEVDNARVTQSPHGLRSDGEEVVARFDLTPEEITMEIADPNQTSNAYSNGWQ